VNWSTEDGLILTQSVIYSFCSDEWRYCRPKHVIC